jgi:glucuronokinase
MTTGQSVVGTCTARAALAGNPSDGYGGAVVAIPLDDLRATASAAIARSFSVHAADTDLLALLNATAEAFAEAKGSLPAVSLSASTSIPRSVGLAGSSALIIAALRALAAASSHRWQPIELAHLALSVERDRLGIEAGLQDRLVQAVGAPVAMTFDPVDFTILRPEIEFHLLVAWTPDAATTSDTVHRSLRRRFDGDDPKVLAAMEALAVQAKRAQRAIEVGRADMLGDAMNTTFELRTSIIDVGDQQRALHGLARSKGLAANSAGSGGSLIGLAQDLERLTTAGRALEQAGHRVLLVDSLAG